VNASLFAVLGLGVLMGMQHATEADHLAAIATLAAREQSLWRGLRHGVAWGLGHTLMLLLVAGGIGLLGWVISPELAGRFEQVVGAMLIVLGAHLAWRLYRERFHFHGHLHGDSAHFHGHSHRPAPGMPPPPHRGDPHRHPHHLPLRSMAVGMVHGLAGSAALALLISQRMPTPAWGLLYIALFGLGSIAGMAVLSGALAMPMGLLARHLTMAYRALNIVAAACSVVLGATMVIGP